MKRVVYLEYLAHPAFAEIIGTRPDVRLSRFTGAMPAGQADALLAAAHAYQIPATHDDVPARFRGDGALFARAPDLLVVSSSGAGYDTLDVDACTAAGVAAVNQAGGNREAVAEHALGMILCLSKRIVQSDRALRRGDVRDRTDFMGHDVQGMTAGIIGLGAIGTRLAELCRFLFGMRVLAFDPLLSPEETVARGAEPVSLDGLLRQSDIVSVHCPLTEDTRGMLGAAQFAAMPRHALFVTTARGGIHDEAALEAALRSGGIAGAGLDVWATEPPPASHPLLGLDNVVASCHTAGVTHEARRNIAVSAANQLLELFDGRRPANLLNPEVWPAFESRLRARFPPVRPAGE